VNLRRTGFEERGSWRGRVRIDSDMSSTATPTLLVATWRDGLLALSDGASRHEFAGRSVVGAIADGRGGALAIVDKRTLCRRADAGEWNTIATASVDLACCVPLGDVIYAGTDDARVLRIDARGRVEPLPGLDAIAGRDTWYAGAALVNGKLLGPPLGIRSITATCDGAVLLANVHVGGIPRSTDGGATWQPTIDIGVDVHQVCAHPTRPGLVAAASGAGLCVSHDAGATWSIEHEGLHASYCSAVAFCGDDVLIAASADPFAAQGAIYRRPIGGHDPLQPVGGGLPRWITGICDTGCIAVRDAVVALADRAGHLYVSEDSGRTWSCRPTGHAGPSSVAMV
jgi:hypothetical protein